MTELFASAAGYAALSITAISFCMTSDHVLQRLNIVGCLFWMIHFALIGAVAATLMLALAVIMILTSAVKMHRVSRIAWQINLGLIPAIAVMCLLGYAAWPSLTPVIGGFLINTGISRCRGHIMSLMVVGGELFWILTGLFLGSLPVIAANLLNIAALGVRTLLKLKDKHQIPPTSKQAA